MHAKLFLVFFLMSAPTGKAGPRELEVNAREACRQVISGAYIKAYSERNSARDLVRGLMAQIAALRQALAAARANLSHATASLDQNGYDLELIARRDEARVAVGNLNAQLGDYESQLSKAESQAQATSQTEARLLSAVSKVFTIKRQDDLADGGYPLRIDYRSPCPKYRALCPLPPQDSETLGRLTVEGAVPEACKRYIGQSRIR